MAKQKPTYSDRARMSRTQTHKKIQVQKLVNNKY